MTATLLEQFATRAIETPGAQAIDGATSIEYGTLGGQVAGLAAVLRDEAPAGAVMIVIGDRGAAATAILAAMAAERTFACFDVRSPAPRLAAQLAALPPSVLLRDHAREQLVSDAVRDADGSRPYVLDYARAAPARGDAESLLRARRDTGYVAFTSGTTGRPKAIRASLGAVGHFIDWETAEFQVSNGTRVSALTSPAFDAFLRDAFVPLCAGGTMCVPLRESMLVGAELATWLDSAAVEVLHCVPTVLRTLRDTITSHDLPRLRSVLLAGEPVRPADVAWWRGLYADRIEMVNMYGPSETTMVKTFRRLDRTDVDAEVVAVGRPLPGVGIELENVRAGVGEIALRVPFELGGYLDGEQAGFDPEDAWRYRTGDFGLFDSEGDLVVLGRRDRQVKLDGNRVELADVEAAIIAHNGVQDVRVRIIQPAGRDLLCAYVVGRADLDEAELREHARSHLPPALVPGAFVLLDALPRTITGKVDDAALPQPSSVGPQTVDELAATPTEAELMRLWSRTLDVDVRRRDADFMLLGGTSRAMLLLLDRIRSRFGVELSIAAFLSDPTVASVAAAIESASQPSGAR